MRKILWIPGLLALGWTAWWLWSAQAQQGAVADWLAERRADGWQAEAAEIGIAGFPLTLETTLLDLALADPQSGLAWDAPRLDFAQPAWQPTRITVTWPDIHRLRTPRETLILRNDALRADLETRAAPGLPLERAALRAATFTVEDSGGDTTSLADLELDIVRGEGTRYDVTLVAEGVALSGPLQQAIGGDLPESLERARLDLGVTFDRPWDLDAIARARPQPTALDLRLLEAGWGPMALRMSADLQIDEGGIPEGTVAVQAENWRDMLAVAEASGALAPGIAGTLANGLGLLAGMSGNRAALDIELAFADGRVFVGPIPLGPAPRLRLR